MSKGLKGLNRDLIKGPNRGGYCINLKYIFYIIDLYGQNKRIYNHLKLVYGGGYAPFCGMFSSKV